MNKTKSQAGVSSGEDAIREPLVDAGSLRQISALATVLAQQTARVNLVDVHGQSKTWPLPPGSLAFTFC